MNCSCYYYYYNYYHAIWHKTTTISSLLMATRDSQFNLNFHPPSVSEENMWR